eukprot:CAMPEP_0172157094 /NCGR_PEP_ID=MMETSP1050-20130122/3592_1 /TAXON_ID=233186 /ORGANISM="Cryptomonas curvata, Strain CCAP979/52" /LENGTH=153 /DNA_ID=CAMNT_0012826269 /DNA_START=68 /DNA_END=529 /DNA_ORIENTATION=-
MDTLASIPESEGGANLNRQSSQQNEQILTLLQSLSVRLGKIEEDNNTGRIAVLSRLDKLEKSKRTFNMFSTCFPCIGPGEAAGGNPQRPLPQALGSEVARATPRSGSDESHIVSESEIARAATSSGSEDSCAGSTKTTTSSQSRLLLALSGSA